MGEKPEMLSRGLVSTIDRFIARLQTENAADSTTKIGLLEDLRRELHTNGQLPFNMGEPGASVLWDLIEDSASKGADESHRDARSAQSERASGSEAGSSAAPEAKKGER